MYLYKYQTDWALFAGCYAPLIVVVIVTVPGIILYNRKKSKLYRSTTKLKNEVSAHTRYMCIFELTNLIESMILN